MNTNLDEKLLVPFSFGWVRKVAYRPLQRDGTKSVGPIADICYITPDQTKFWTKKRLVQYLDENPHLGLTKENFSFSYKPFGLNDETKEIIFQKCSDQEPIKITPGKYSNYTTTNGFVTTKATRKAKVPRSQKNKLGTSRNKSSKPAANRKRECTNLKLKIQKTTLGLSCASSNNNSIKTANDANELSTSQDVEMESAPPLIERIATTSSFDNNAASVAAQNFVYTFEGYKKIFSYLDIKDFINVQRVCKTWRNIVQILPKTRISVKGLRITNWEAFANFLIANRTVYLDLTGVLDANFFNWEHVTSILAKTNVRQITLNDCTPAIAEEITRTCMKLQLGFECDSISLTFTKILTSDERSNSMFSEISYVSAEGFNVTGNLASLLGLSFLTDMDIKVVKTLRDYQLSEEIRLFNLDNTLRLEREETSATIRFNMFEGICNLKSIENLQLINFDIEDNFHFMLRKCKSLKSLVVNPVSFTVSANDKILEGIIHLKDTLEYVIWALSIQRIRKAKYLLGKQCQRDVQSDTEFMPISERVSDLLSKNINDSVINKEEQSDEPKKILINFIPLWEVEEMLKSKFPNLTVCISKIDRLRSAPTPAFIDPL